MVTRNILARSYQKQQEPEIQNDRHKSSSMCHKIEMAIGHIARKTEGRWGPKMLGSRLHTRKRIVGDFPLFGRITYRESQAGGDTKSCPVVDVQRLKQRRQCTQKRTNFID